MRIPHPKKTKDGVLDVWNRSPTLFMRDNEGNLLPRSVPLLGSVDEEIIMIPLSIAQLREIKIQLKMNSLQSKDIMNELLNRCLIYPTKEYLNAIKPDYYERIKLTILFENGFELFDRPKKTSDSSKSEARRLLDLFLMDESYALQAVLLHELGYTYFTIPKLTRYEINLLLSSTRKINKKRNEV